MKGFIRNLNKKRFILFALLHVFLSIGLFSQKIIRGTVIDGNTGEPLIGATVYEKSKPTEGTMTDFDGNYSLKIKTENPVIVISYIGYQAKEKKISPGGDKVISETIALIPDNVGLEEVVVTAKSDRSKDIVLKTMQMKSAGTFDYISKETISKIGDSKVDDAVKRVTGVSTVQGFITVRGVSDRYIKTTLNGNRIPTLDPFTNNLKLDIFSTSLIDNVIISKTHRPDLPADWAGAYLSIETKDYPEQFLLHVKSSFGYNSITTFNDVVASQRGPTDWLGYDDGYRDIDHPGKKNFPVINNGTGLKSIVYHEFNALGLGDYMNSLGISKDHLSDFYHKSEENIYYRLGMVELGLLAPAHIDNDQQVHEATMEYDEIGGYQDLAFKNMNADLTAFNTSLPNTWITEQREAPMSYSGELTIGDQLLLFKNPLGLLFSFRYSSSLINNKWDNIYNMSFLSNGQPVRISDPNIRQETTESYGWNALISASYKFNPKHSIQFIFMPNFLGKNRARFNRFYYNNAASAEGYLYKDKHIQRYEERKQLVYQMRSNHFFPTINLKITTDASYTTGERNIPDYRAVSFGSFNNNGTSLSFGPTNNENEREYRYLDEQLLHARISAELPVNAIPGFIRKLKFGGSYLYQKRNTEQFLYPLQGGQDFGKFSDPVAYFEHENFIPEYGRYKMYYTVNADVDDYTIGFKKISSGFAMMDYQLIQKLRLFGGLRLEHTDILSDLTEYYELGLPSGDPRRKLPPNAGLVTDSKYHEFSEINELNYLPSGGVLYRVWDNDKVLFNTRINYGRSIARPSIREISSIWRKDIELNNYVLGNPNLKITEINNYDIRFESFFTSGEYVSLSGFHKIFYNPITLFIPVKAFSWKNTNHTKLLGVEIEGKKYIINGLSFGANVTFVDSYDAESGGRRPLYGQSPYIFNAVLDYNVKKIMLSTALSYNVQGPKLAALGERGRVPNIYEMPRKLLDFKVSKSFGNHIGVSFKIRNILNAPVSWMYDNIDKDKDWSSATFSQRLKSFWSDVFGIKNSKNKIDWKIDGVSGDATPKQLNQVLYERYYLNGTNYVLSVTYDL